MELCKQKKTDKILQILVLLCLLETFIEFHMQDITQILVPRSSLSKPANKPTKQNRKQKTPLKMASDVTQW